MAGATGGKQDLLHSPDLHKIPSCHSAHQTKSRQTHLPVGQMNLRLWTPIQSSHTGRPTSTCSLPAPECSTNEAGKSAGELYSLTTTPPPPQRRRRKPNPRTTRTTTADQREHGGLHHLAKPRGPSEARKTAGPAGGDPNARCRLSQEMETLRERSRTGPGVLELVLSIRARAIRGVLSPFHVI